MTLTVKEKSLEMYQISTFFSNNVVLHPEFLSRSGSHVLLDVWQTPLFKFFINYSVSEKRGVSCPVRYRDMWFIAISYTAVWFEDCKLRMAAQNQCQLLNLSFKKKDCLRIQGKSCETVNVHCIIFPLVFKNSQLTCDCIG